MTTRANTLDGGTNGVAVSVGNSGGASGDAFTTILGTAPTFATGAAVHGSLGISCQGASGAQAAVDWQVFGSTSMASRIYYKYTTRTVTTQLAQFRSSVGAVAGCNQKDTGNALYVTDSAGTTIASSTSPAMTNGVTYRVEIEVFSSATVGFVNFRMYVGDSSTAFHTFASPATVNTRGGNITMFRFGKFSASTDTTAFLFDDPKAIDGTTTPLGPALSADAGPDLSDQEPYTTVNLDGTGSVANTYLWTQTAGSPTPTINNSTSAIANVKVPGTIAGVTLTFRLQVDGTATDTMTLEALPVTERVYNGSAWVPAELKVVS